jgi:hypothetical protein
MDFHMLGVTINITGLVNLILKKQPNSSKVQTKSKEKRKNRREKQKLKIHAWFIPLMNCLKRKRRTLS